MIILSLKGPWLALSSLFHSIVYSDSAGDKILPESEQGIIAQSFHNHPNTSLVTRKPVFGVCDQGRHYPACTATEAS